MLHAAESPHFKQLELNRPSKLMSNKLVFNHSCKAAILTESANEKSHKNLTYTWKWIKL